MNKSPIYVDPLTRTQLSLEVLEAGCEQVVRAQFINTAGIKYEVINGIPDFRVNLSQLQWLDYYENKAATYDDFCYLTFTLQGFEEEQTREYVVSKLTIQPGEKILEIGCGTGKDSLIISKQLGDSGELYLLDVSPAMLTKCREKLSSRTAHTEFVLADSVALPFPVGYFDKVFSFVTLPAISNISQCIKEITRVSKPGAKIVIGSEGLLPSLKNTLFGKLTIRNCDLYDHEVPLKDLPPVAQNVKVEWILNGIIFLLEFNVAATEPAASTMMIPGKRGGSLYTRYFGQLEGVSNETKQLALAAMKKSTLTNHEWLSHVIIEAAKKL